MTQYQNQQSGNEKNQRAFKCWDISTGGWNLHDISV